MQLDPLAAFEADLIGRACRISRRETDWRIDMDHGTSIALSVPWRIVSNGRIALVGEDDGQMFGRAEAMDGEAESRRLLGGRRIVKAAVDRQTADLTLHFDQDVRLDAFNNSSGYEGWQGRFRLGGKWQSVIALGGGVVMLLDE